MSSTFDAGRPLLVGGLYSETGATAFVERAQRNATLLAIEEINAQGGVAGREVVLASYDAQSSAALAAHNSCYRQWVAVGGKDNIPMASTTFGIDNEQVLTSPAEHNGIVVSYAYFDSIQTPANLECIKRYQAKYGDKADTMTEGSAMTYHGVNVWAKAAEKAGAVDHDAVITALESGVSFEGPAGKTTIDAATRHDTLDVYIAEVKDNAFHVLESYSQQKPADTAAVCDLQKTPRETKQFVINVKL